HYITLLAPYLAFVGEIEEKGLMFPNS
ncbi:MAG: hypothetical protein RBG13Loki_3167, partial [Promethearchaeota archaeon CR_4]